MQFITEDIDAARGRRVRMLEAWLGRQSATPSRRRSWRRGIRDRTSSRTPLQGVDFTGVSCDSTSCSFSSVRDWARLAFPAVDSSMVGGEAVLAQYGTSDIVNDLVFNTIGALIVAGWSTAHLEVLATPGSSGGSGGSPAVVSTYRALSRKRFYRTDGPKRMEQAHLGFDRYFEVAMETAEAQAAEMTIEPGRSVGGPENYHADSDQWLFVVCGFAPHSRR